MNKLIQDILEWYSVKYVNDNELSEQLIQIQIKEIKYTGIGFYINFELKNKVASLKNPDSFPLDGPIIFSSDIDNFAEVLLWQIDGFISSLEIYTSGDFITEQIKHYYLKDNNINNV